MDVGQEEEKERSRNLRRGGINFLSTQDLSTCRHAEAAVTTESRGMAQKGDWSCRAWVGGEVSAVLVVHGCDLGVRRSVEVGELWVTSSCRA